MVRLLKVVLLVTKFWDVGEDSRTCPELCVNVPPVLLNAPWISRRSLVEVKVPAVMLRSPAKITGTESETAQVPVPLMVRSPKVEPPKRILLPEALPLKMRPPVLTVKMPP